MGFIFELISEISSNAIQNWDKMKNKIRVPIFIVALASLILAIYFYSR